MEPNLNTVLLVVASTLSGVILYWLKEWKKTVELDLEKTEKEFHAFREDTIVRLVRIEVLILNGVKKL